MQPDMDELARRYVEVAVQLGERDPDSLDFYSGGDRGREELRRRPAPLEGLSRSALELQHQIEALPQMSGKEAARKAFLQAQVGAILMRIPQLKGVTRTFDEESKTFFGVVAPADSEIEVRRRFRLQIAELLPNASNLSAAYARYDAQFVVPRERVPRVMEAALQRCRALTVQHMVLPPNERVDVHYVFHKPWSAFSHYLGNFHSLIEVNMDYPITIDRLLDLACHEGYPGHHVFNSIRDQAMVQAAHRIEFQVQPTFSPQSYVSEAAASYGPSLVLSDAARLSIERDLLFPLAGIKVLDAGKYLQVQKLVSNLHSAEPSIAREYLDGRLEYVRAADALERETLMEHGETTLLYLNEYRTYMLTYTLGRDVVQAWVEAGSPTNAIRWQRYRELMTGPVLSLPSPGVPAATD